ncbi:MAG: tripartite tricarboxylate transporter permease [Candidatus Diapherotrites archaeon]
MSWETGLGILLGTLSGLLPGLHLNNVSFAFVQFFPSWGLAGMLVIVSATLAHTVFDFLPSILLGAPDENFLSVLPGHAMVLEGKGLHAIQYALLGCLLGGIFALLLSLLLIPLYAQNENFWKWFIPWILLFWMMGMVWRSKHKLFALLIIAASGAFGLLSISFPAEYGLIAFISGFFGASVMVQSLKAKSKWVPQSLQHSPIEWREVFPFSLLGAVAGGIVSLLPSLGPSEAAALSQSLVVKHSRERFLVLLGAINASNALLGFGLWFSLGKLRTGSAVALDALGAVSFPDFVTLMLAAVSALCISVFLAWNFSPYFIRLLEKVSYSKLNWAVLALLCAFVLLLTPPFAWLLFAAAASLGVVCSNWNVRKTSGMAFLMLPTIVLFWGLSF